MNHLYETERAPLAGDLRIERVEAEGEIVLSLTGELDISSARDLELELEAAQASGAPKVVVDMAGLEFIDSTGLRVLLAAWRSADGRGQQLVLRNAQNQVRRLFEVAGILEKLSLDGD